VDDSLPAPKTVRSDRTLHGKEQDMRKAFCIVIGLTIAATAASAAQGQQPSPIQRIIAQENAKAMTLHRVPRLQPVLDGRSPDTIDAALRAHAADNGQAGLDLRSPDTRDAAFAAHAAPAPTVVVVSSSGFDWTDAGIGGAAVFAIVLLAAGGLTLTRDGRQQKAHG